MTGIILGWSWADDGTAYASSEAGDMIAENVLDVQPRRRWRAVGDGPHLLTLDWGVNKPVNMLVIAFNNLTISSSVCISLYDQAGDTLWDQCNTGEFSELGWGIQPLGEYGLGGTWGNEGAPGSGDENYEYKDNDYIIFSLPQEVQASSVAIEVSDGGNEDGYIELGRIKVGKAIPIKFTAGYEMGWMDTTTLTRTRGGALRSNNGRPYRYANVPVTMDDDQVQLHQIYRDIGRRYDIVWSGFPPLTSNNSSENLILGRFTDFNASVYTNEGVTTSFSIEEAI